MYGSVVDGYQRFQLSRPTEAACGYAPQSSTHQPHYMVLELGSKQFRCYLDCMEGQEMGDGIVDD